MIFISDKEVSENKAVRNFSTFEILGVRNIYNTVISFYVAPRPLIYFLEGTLVDKLLEIHNVYVRKQLNYHFQRCCFSIIRVFLRVNFL